MLSPITLTSPLRSLHRHWACTPKALEGCCAGGEEAWASQGELAICLLKERLHKARLIKQVHIQPD